MHACADTDENGSYLKKIGPTPPQSNTKPIRIEGRPSDVSRQPSDGRQTECVDKSAMRMRRLASLASLRFARFASLRFAFGGNVTLSTSTHRHYDESVHRIKQLTRGHNTIGFSDILSRIRNSTTTPFMSEDMSFDLSTALFHVTMYRQYARKVGNFGYKRQFGSIRYYLPRLKLYIALPSRNRGN